MDKKDYISKTEAAEILGSEALKDLVEQGVLKPTAGSTTKQTFDANDVELLAETQKESLTLEAAVSLARLSEFRARRAERLVQQLMDVLGISIPTLSTDQAELGSLYLKAVDDLSEERSFNTDEIYTWAKTLFALGEEHLEALELYLGHEVEQVFLDLSKKLRLLAKKEEGIEALAFKYLGQASRHLKNVVYCHLKKKYGVRAGRKSVGAADGELLSLNEELINLMFSEVIM